MLRSSPKRCLPSLKYRSGCIRRRYIRTATRGLVGLRIGQGRGQVPGLLMPAGRIERQVDHRRTVGSVKCLGPEPETAFAQGIIPQPTTIVGGLDHHVGAQAYHVVHWVAGVVGSARGGLQEGDQAGPSKTPVSQQQGPDRSGQMVQRRRRKNSSTRFWDGSNSSGRDTQLSRGSPRRRKQTAANKPLRPWPRSDQSIIIGVSPRNLAAWQTRPSSAVCTAMVSKRALDRNRNPPQADFLR